MHTEIKKYLEESLQNKKGLRIHINGSVVVGYVTRIDQDIAELASREFTKILVFVDRVDAIEMS